MTHCPLCYLYWLWKPLRECWIKLSMIVTCQALVWVVKREDHLLVTHLLFADDTLIFCGVDLDQVLFLHMILIWFEAVSRLKINLGKSELVPVGMVDNLDLLLIVLGCKQGTLPMKNLGLPLGAKFKDKAIWNPILEKIEQRLVGWKRLSLSK